MSNSRNQSGCRKQHSTKPTVIRVTNDLLMTADTGEYSVLLLLDLSVVFDITDRNTLINGLNQRVLLECLLNL